MCVIQFTRETSLSRNIYFPMTVAVVGLLHVLVIVSCNIWMGCIVQRHIRKVYNSKAVSGVEDESIQQAKENINKMKKFETTAFCKGFSSCHYN